MKVLLATKPVPLGATVKPTSRATLPSSKKSLRRSTGVARAGSAMGRARCPASPGDGGQVLIKVFGIGQGFLLLRDDDGHSARSFHGWDVWDGSPFSVPQTAGAGKGGPPPEARSGQGKSRKRSCYPGGDMI